MRIISLGWGVQSFALAAMSALGMLPKVDAAVHADTGHERAETYALAEKWTPWLEERGVRVITVRCPDNNFIRPWGKTIGLMIAAHTCWPDGRSSGMTHRQCTREWKIRPVRRWCADELKRRGQNKTPGIVEQWIGITLDEIERMRASSGVKYVALAYPFVEHLDRPWTRNMVIRWLTENGLEIPVKSSCIFCPYHDRQTWRDIQLSGNGDWEKVLEVDRAIRNKRLGYLCYLTAQRKPLNECDFRSQEEHGQLTLWEAEECSGMCFL